MFPPIYKCVIQHLSYVIIFFYRYKLYGKILSHQFRCPILEKNSMLNVVVHVFIVSLETTCQKKKSNKEIERRYLCCCYFSNRAIWTELMAYMILVRVFGKCILILNLCWWNQNLYANVKKYIWTQWIGTSKVLFYNKVNIIVWQ